MLTVLKKIKTVMNRVIMIVASILTIVLVLGALWQVFSRYVLNDPSTFTEELLRFLLIWVAMLGTTYAFGSNEHLAIIYLKNKLRDEQRKYLQLFIDFTIIFFAGLILIKGGYSLSTSTLNQLSPILRIPMGYIYAILPISGTFIVFYQIINMFERREQTELAQQAVTSSVSPHTRKE
ncbi:TRAP transporter small permease [Halalkalibacterium halodurans]|jgi:TRAP-type C4-dicarboxylate transport system permease small subunit|uniref:C4-dicarboxylate ABC transporter permease n=1 Tax=Halalkalibacterium halodurans TaxID=86665 RepID=A0A0M0KCU2_ALKHA|nr:TRAP transporter small permease [Halalkalibacterium halodurans]MED4122967.1 TRAP transporter small permease [Halalkalibacterium halodurans]TPE70049.1 TRAP transporter small permease [Halalkalibacterium halodurans]